jgi:Fe-S-cluster-containing dehydrogenase component
MGQKLVLKTELCTACRACELACHYHHQKTFGTIASSIRVDFNGDTGTVRIQIDSSCDDCLLEASPLCFQACKPGAIQLG